MVTKSGMGISLIGVKDAEHSLQNLEFEGFSDRHAGHCISASHAFLTWVKHNKEDEEGQSGELPVLLDFKSRSSFQERWNCKRYGKGVAGLPIRF
jgi:hypothetical protein